MMGGETAGALRPPASMNIVSSLIARTEVRMSDYGAFLADLARTGKRAEAEKHLPRDFGKSGSGFVNMAELTAAGDLVPATYRNAGKEALAQYDPEIRKF